ncbi:dTDP-4-amino-4,6-dideoxygalactose transaminase [bacterium]|nr:dTDP-4-amino-4,6-dideoxygalactose transaminase [bacterium]
MIPFNKPHVEGKEIDYIKDAISTGKISGNGIYTKKCHDFFKLNYGFGKCLLTQSCTDALEMAAILCNVEPGDEVIIPSFTFVSTANAFALRGAKIVFADSLPYHPNIDHNKIEELITNKTKVIVPVHYAGNACNMPKIMELANRYNILVVEDAAQAFNANYINNNKIKQPLGTYGHLATFSFHETKNIISGEGGLLVVNDPAFVERSEIIWEKGTNRTAFFRGEVDKYGWVDIGSSFLPSEITAAFLLAQLEASQDIQLKRKEIWERYSMELNNWCTTNEFASHDIPKYSDNNAHIFYVLAKNIGVRDAFIEKLKKRGILAVFHYQSLHKSLFMRNTNHSICDNSDRYSKCLIRLPIYVDLTYEEQSYIIKTIKNFNCNELI